MDQLLRYVLLFFFYSAAGWAVESTYCSFGEKRIINRGFLSGPMCPIYGSGALVMTIFLYNPFKAKPLMVFLLGMILCDIVEYITSFLMETLFHARWWDYTYEFINIRGRICLKHTLYWGVASVAFVYIIHPGVDSLLQKIEPKTLIIIVSVVLTVFLADVIHAVIKALDIRHLQIKLSYAMTTISSGLNHVKNSIEDKYTSIQDTLDIGNEKINSVKSDIYEQIQELIGQFELRFSARGSKKQNNQNKYSNRYMRNSMNIEKFTRKQLDKLKKIAEDLKANLFENDEKQ